MHARIYQLTDTCMHAGLYAFSYLYALCVPVCLLTNGRMDEGIDYILSTTYDIPYYVDFLPVCSQWKLSQSLLAITISKILSWK